MIAEAWIGPNAQPRSYGCMKTHVVPGAQKNRVAMHLATATRIVRTD